MTDRLPETADAAPARGWLAALAAALTWLVGFVVAVRGGVPLADGDDVNRLAVAGFTLVVDGSFTLAWLAAAAGYGHAAERILLGRRRGVAAQLALGGGALMMLAWLAGWAGLLGVASAWAMIIAGWAMLLWQLRPRFAEKLQPPRRWPWPVVLAMPALALLVVAAMIPPGILWQPTEKGAYDVLSYHLQLPKEWLASGAMVGFHHNVYSYLTGGFEAVYYHLAALRGGAVAAALSCQLLHAAMAVVAAAAVAAAVKRLAVAADLPDRAASVSAAAAGAVYLAAPWVIVTGTLAYNEQAMVALGAAALGLAFEPDATPAWRRGLAVGLLVGGAAMCKLTALAMFGLPAAVILLACTNGSPRTRAAALLTLSIGVAAPIGLFMTRNALWTGNPLFPMLTDRFGTAHWTAEQAARWQAAHSPALSIDERAERLLTMLLLHRQYAFVLWPAGLAAMLGGLAVKPLRRAMLLLAAAVLMQLACWLAFTHVQSRFMIVGLVPLVMAIGLGLSAIRRPALRNALAAALILGPFAVAYDLYLDQGGGAAAQWIGQTAAVRQQAPPWAAFNALPPGRAKLCAEAYATPLYFTQPITYHTVWDRSELGAMIDADGVAGAIARLRRDGYTHLLIDRLMLGIWWSPGNYGYDPSITPERLGEIDRLGLRVAYDQPGVMVIYDLTAGPQD